jgi:pSer/pThr/pTyr-binding forkhead associated (FHA) protein
MTTRLTLTLPPAFGNRNVDVDLKRFSIGRTDDNDLEINDSSLSRRHALIEEFDGRFTLSDCGSSNGTFLNGIEVTSPVELSDWDILTFGGVSDVLVRIEASSSDSSHMNEESLIPAGNGPQQHQASNLISSNALTPIISIVVAAIIITISLILLLVYPGSDRGSIQTGQRSANDPERAKIPNRNSQSAPTVEEDASPKSLDAGTDNESTESASVETYASRLLSSVSRDTRPYLTEKPLTAITSYVERYRSSSSLESNLRNMKRALPQVTAVAKANGVRAPIAVYVTMTTIDENGGRGDPAQVAAAVCPRLAVTLRAFGDELASDSLLSIAALKEGTGLQVRLARLRSNESPNTMRSIWYLYDHQVISNETYNFVIRFIAIGVIAQDPGKFGLNVEPIVF